MAAFLRLGFTEEPFNPNLTRRLSGGPCYPQYTESQF